VAFSQPYRCFASNGTFQKVKSYPFSGRGDTQKPPEPLTRYPGAENRLNVFSIYSDQPDVRPCVFPWPARVTQKFSRSPIALQNFSAVRFFIQLTASDCAPVKVTMTVTLTTEPFHPIVELE
jgi:hypothetical protein